MASAEHPKDLLDKAFTFPQETSSDHVRLELDQEEFKALTVCQRFYTDLKRNHSLFSLATPNHRYAFLTYIYKKEQRLEVYVRGHVAKFEDVNCASNRWHSICTTWDVNSGMVRVWLNGEYLTPQSITDKPLTGKAIITLGQEQEYHGGGFKSEHSFRGMITDVHMWDYKLSDHEIEKYMKNKKYTPGNVLNWTALDYEIKGNVLVEEKPNICLC